VEVTRILIDTSAYLSGTRGHLEVQRAVDECSDILVSPIVLGEVLLGIRRTANPQRERQLLSAFLDLPEVQIVEVDSETSARYAEIHDFLRLSGTPVTPNDLWIAASAMQHGLRLLTTDSDFQKIPHILVEYFPPTGASA
jgi:tRNA(fMet)-specific endonuclease VapC